MSKSVHNSNKSQQLKRLSPSGRSIRSSNNTSTIDDQIEQFVIEDNHKREDLTIPQKNMKAFFKKLASNNHLKTLKEKGEGQESLYSIVQCESNKDKNKTYEMKTVESKINIEDYIMNDADLLINETLIFNDSIKALKPIPDNKRDRKKHLIFRDNYKTYTQISIKKRKTQNKSLIHNDNIQHNNKKKKINSMETSAYNTFQVNGNMNHRATESKLKSTLNSSISNNYTNTNFNKQINSNKSKCVSYNAPKTPCKTKQSFKHNTESIILRDSLVSTSSKKDILNDSMSKSNGKCKATDFKKRKTVTPTNSLRKSKPEHRSSVSAHSNGGDMQLIEEYDYNKILSDIKSIFGDNLEFFDENLLFSSLDETTNKGFIKGLIMLSYFQEKKLNTLNDAITQLKTQHKEEIDSKDKTIDEMSNSFNCITSHLKSGKFLCINALYYL